MIRFLKRKVDKSSEFVDVDTLPSDPYDRKPIESYFTWPDLTQTDPIRTNFFTYIPWGLILLKMFRTPMKKFMRPPPLETFDLRECLYIDLEGDIGRKQCSKQIKYLKLPNDSLEGCPYIYIHRLI
ncbi:hypothetical protein Hanom_Chr14g01322001 [Helianthus anomalus]